MDDVIVQGEGFSDLCWYCELCGVEVAIDSEDDPLPDGWAITEMRTGIGVCGVVVCSDCLAREME